MIASNTINLAMLVVADLIVNVLLSADLAILAIVYDSRHFAHVRQTTLMGHFAHVTHPTHLTLTGHFIKSDFNENFDFNANIDKYK